jgi:hypothetical protein
MVQIRVFCRPLGFLPVVVRSAKTAGWAVRMLDRVQRPATLGLAKHSAGLVPAPSGVAC